ncbi:MAG: hypothetical protein M1826_005979 [Phylliscum demangeonii]|nr:MAG: hypothetical protein M1826_005979 [Phylliscum demangeonii]
MALPGIYFSHFASPCIGRLARQATVRRSAAPRLPTGLEMAPGHAPAASHLGIRPFALFSAPGRRKKDELRSEASCDRPSSRLRRILHSLLVSSRPPPPVTSASGPPSKLYQANIWNQFREDQQEIENLNQVDGPPFRSQPLTQAEIDVVFGPGVPVEAGNRMLRFQQRLRIEGRLADNDVGMENELTKKFAATALAWLRAFYPVDEEACFQDRDARDRRRRQEYIVADAERLGIHKPPADDSGGVQKAPSVFGKSALDRIREDYQRRTKEMDRQMETELKHRRRKRAEEDIARSKSLALQRQAPGGELVTHQEPEWVQYYRKRAMLSQDPTVPYMSRTRRLLPGALLTVTVIGLCALFSHYYTPPARSDRLWPDIPPAAATVLGIILINTAIFICWRVPPLWRTLNTYFITAPGYPYTLSLLGNIFSHQAFAHLMTNMVTLWFVGTLLHDQVGRGDFLAVYLSSGAFGSLVSLFGFVVSRNLISASLGASGAVTGVIAAWCTINSGQLVHFPFIPKEIMPPLSTDMLLLVLVSADVAGLLMGIHGVDHWCHLGGFAMGMVAARWIRWRDRNGIAGDEGGGPDGNWEDEGVEKGGGEAEEEVVEEEGRRGALGVVTKIYHLLPLQILVGDSTVAGSTSDSSLASQTVGGRQHIFADDLTVMRGGLLPGSMHASRQERAIPSQVSLPGARPSLAMRVLQNLLGAEGTCGTAVPRL